MFSGNTLEAFLLLLEIRKGSPPSMFIIVLGELANANRWERNFKNENWKWEGNCIIKQICN